MGHHLSHAFEQAKTKLGDHQLESECLPTGTEHTAPIESAQQTKQTIVCAFLKAQIAKFVTVAAIAATLSTIAVNAQTLEVGRTCSELAYLSILVFAVILIASSLLHLFLVLIRGRSLVESSMQARLLLTVSAVVVILAGTSFVISAIMQHGFLVWAEAEILVVLNLRFSWELARYLWKVKKEPRAVNSICDSNPQKATTPESVDVGER